ncbi:MAG: hypothetical protein KDB40_11010 [Acidimicrobiales bacterium]|nr:hypothetical protein [Acidimicrobiales bacterium]MCB9393808.1 hypothetical protein [Acidimicrobiaceae bacterium]
MITAADLAAWLNVSHLNFELTYSEEETALMEQVCEAATRWIEARVDAQFLLHEDISFARLLYASRLWNRRNMPDAAIIGDGFVSGVRKDGDVEALIAPYRKVRFA